MKREWQTRVAGIVVIGGLDAYALSLGHNGVLLATSIAAVAGIAGYSLGKVRGRAADNEGVPISN